MANRSVVFLLILLIPLWLTATAGASPPLTEEGASPQEKASSVWSALTIPTAGAPTQEQESRTADCRTCHEAELTSFNRTYHASQEESCYACHESDQADEHLKGMMEGEAVPGPSMTARTAEEVNSVCLSCHETTDHPGWEGSSHQRRGLSCTECHSIHSFRSERKQLKTEMASETCFTCHKDIRAQSLRTSHHPVREGLMGCESCHNPHDGTTPKMIKADWQNELCLKCHTEKRGPFLWEHAPVRENCLNCHNPHGSNHDKMLVAKLPYLCQRCHLNTRHPGTLYDGQNAGTTIAAATNRAIEHACKNCHQNIHGSNAPSAPYLGR